MLWKIKNVALDPAHSAKRAVAQKLEMEPLIAGTRVRLRQSITISDEQYASNEERIKRGVKQGVLTAEMVGGAGHSPEKADTPPLPPENKDESSKTLNPLDSPIPPSSESGDLSASSDEGEDKEEGTTEESTTPPTGDVTEPSSDTDEEKTKTEKSSGRRRRGRR